MPESTVIIGGAQTAVQSRTTPSGWHRIGVTERRLFDPANDPPTLFSPGDRVRFTVIEVLSPGILASMQDCGRPGRRDLGVGSSGAMDGRALRIDNLMVGNAPDPAGIEIALGGIALRFHRDTAIALTAGDRLGEAIRFQPVSREEALAARAGAATLEQRTAARVALARGYSKRSLSHV